MAAHVTRTCLFSHAVVVQFNASGVATYRKWLAFKHSMLICYDQKVRRQAPDNNMITGKGREGERDSERGERERQRLLMSLSRLNNSFSQGFRSQNV